jgi:uncharacterized damage-inducible protein DinB
MTSDPIDILLAQNRWATRTLLEACATLTDEQLHQRFEMGPGSLHDTITHILGAMRGWGDLHGNREQRPRPEGERRTPQALMAMLDEASDDLEASAAAHPKDELVTGTRGDRTYTFTRGGVLTHVLTHGMHHRAQCLNMLRQLGVAPLPSSSVVEWILMVDAK